MAASKSRVWPLGLCLLVAASGMLRTASAQEYSSATPSSDGAVTITTEGTAVPYSSGRVIMSGPKDPEQMKAMMEAMKAKRSAMAASAESPEEGKPDEDKSDKDKKAKKEGDDEKDKPDKEEGADAGEKESEKSSESIKRPAEPPEPPDPEELKVRPDASGKVQINFTGQSWPDVLQWLADVSKMSLDWQEVPGDYLNLTTQRSYTVDEVRDLINRHLLARGYTLLRRGEGLSVEKIDKLNPGMVPRVAPEELADCDPHEFVKVSFQLDWLMADEAVTELEPMRSPHGKLSALSATNRIEAMDTVLNLQQIYQVLLDEQSSDGRENLMQEFPLKYTRASEVREQLMALLGMEEKKPSGPMTPQQMEQMKQQAQQAAQRAAQQGGKGTPESKPKAEVNLVVNQRKNSILAHAPPDKMAIIAKAIEVIDVQTDQGGSMLSSMDRMQVYRLEAIDPAPVVKTLEELGGLDPLTRLEIDTENNAIVVYASLADHVIIRAMVEKLDSGSRRSEVIQLIELRAESVAKQIDFMMGGGREEPEKKEESSSGYSSYYSPYRSSSSSRSRDRDDDHKDAFRVDADPRTNTLSLWCNDFELKKVLNLLDNLRNIPRTAPETHTVQVHRLVTIDPEPIVNTLESMETLDFHTKLEVDDENKAIVAYASEEDHARISELITKLDGHGRTFEVIQLRKLEADYVAGTIQFMISGEEQESSSMDRYSYYPYTSRHRPEPKDPNDQFRVDADVEFNRLLLLANEIELEEVMNLLVKLGEIPPDGGDTRTVRVLGALPQEETERLLEQLRRAWPSISPDQELHLPDPEELKSDDEEPPTDETEPDGSSDRKTVADRRSPKSFFQTAQLSVSEAEATATEEAAEEQDASQASPPPVTISLTPDGRLMITSKDTKALDRLEELMDNLAPQRSDYKVFSLKYAEAFWVAVNLEDFFKEEEEKDSSRGRYDYYWGYYDSSSGSDDSSRRLSQRRPLKFISDDATNTILVQGADPAQLKTIEDLIELYDQRESTDSQSARRTVVFQIRYSKASVIAETIKDVYRDLLSSNDKALQNNGQQQRPERSYTYYFGDEGGDERMAPKFKGYLSLGIDDLSNALVVSAPEFLFNDLAEVIQALDQVAEPTTDTVRLHKLSKSVDVTDLQKKLQALLRDNPAAGRNTGKPDAANPGGQQPDSTKHTSARISG